MPGFMFRLLLIIVSGSQEERGQLPVGLLHRECINGPSLENHAQITGRCPVTGCSCGSRCKFYKDCFLQTFPVASREGTLSYNKAED